MTPETTTPSPQLSKLKAFMKGDPKALGTVQIMIGVLTLLFGIVFATFHLSAAIMSGITLGASIIFITSGALTVAAANNSNSCAVKAALGMNVVSAMTAFVVLIMFTLHMVVTSIMTDNCLTNRDRNYDCNYFTKTLWNGIYGVLFVFSLLEFIISICTSGFACKATCCTETTPIYVQPMNLMYVQPMNPQPINPQPIYNPPPYNPQAPLQSSVVTRNEV